MKALRYILYGLIIAAAIGLLVWQGLVEKNLDSGNLTRAILLIAGAVIAMLRPARRRQVSNKKVVYQKAYGEFIQNAFADDPKLEKKFYDAVDDYNFERYAAGIDKLEKLRKECQRTADLYAVTVFTALCCDGMQAYEEAIRHYDAAAAIRDNTTLHSNAGLCLTRLGRYEESEEAFRRAIQVDSQNEYAWNNLASLYFRQGGYEEALEFAREAIRINPKMPQALSCAAICCALMGDQEAYESYYRQAVANGYDGKKIKEVVKSLDPAL